MAEIVPFPVQQKPTPAPRTPAARPAGQPVAQPPAKTSLHELAGKMRAETARLRAQAQELRTAVSELIEADLPGQARALAHAATGEVRAHGTPRP